MVINLSTGAIGVKGSSWNSLSSLLNELHFQVCKQWGRDGVTPSQCLVNAIAIGKSLTSFGIG